MCVSTNWLLCWNILVNTGLVQHDIIKCCTLLLLLLCTWSNICWQPYKWFRHFHLNLVTSPFVSLYTEIRSSSSHWHIGDLQYIPTIVSDSPYTINTHIRYLCIGQQSLSIDLTRASDRINLLVS